MAPPKLRLWGTTSPGLKNIRAQNNNDKVTTRNNIVTDIVCGKNTKGRETGQGRSSPEMVYETQQALQTLTTEWFTGDTKNNFHILGNANTKYALCNKHNKDKEKDDKDKTDEVKDEGKNGDKDKDREACYSERQGEYLLKLDR
ncbi:hypothetical protein M434DRAFT_35760 [Hypoxylon sp. CO27-5]|nr:hypothetical protein M434DRAFT_35760 [Hypoxylon sp. CO27-5]